jgi:hypothetical protein
MKRWQKLALVSAILAPVALIGQAFVRTALIPGDPGYFTSMQYTSGYQSGWKHAKSPQSDNSCAPDIAEAPTYDTSAKRFDWAAGYLKGCHDAQHA